MAGRLEHAPGADQVDAAEGRQRRIFGIDTTVVRYEGAVYFVPAYATHRPVAQRVLAKQLVSPRLHRLVGEVQKRRPGDIIHAGAFFGDMLPSFSAKTAGQVLAFEPVVESYLLARQVMNANRLTNVVLMHAALGAEHGTALVETMTKTMRHRGGASRIIRDPSAPTFRPQTVAMMTIDQLTTETLSMIQLDVEGYERDVLLGAVETIRTHQPVISIEDNLGTCADLLADLGYAEAGDVDPDHVYVPAAELGEYRKLLRRPLSGLQNIRLGD